MERNRTISNALWWLKNLIRYIFMPGSDIFTRRRVMLEKHWGKGPRHVLDAGCGNGWFAYRAYRSGAAVVAVANQGYLIDKAKAFYNEFLGIPDNHLHFAEMDIRLLPELRQRFEEIICYEVLEHIKDDRLVCAIFFAALKPGGALHLCCPNAEHPRWKSELLDQNEQGGHVRCGYTEQDYRSLLEPLGFRLETFEGVGGSALLTIQEKLQSPARRWFGIFGAAAVAFLAIPFIWTDVSKSKKPISIYVKAIRPNSKADY